MPSAYDPLFGGGGGAEDDALDRVREAFEEAGRPYLSSPWSWLAWAVALPVAALSTPRALAAAGPAGALLLWSVTILFAGAIEVALLGFGRSRRSRAGSLSGWGLRVQGNLSLVALVLSVALVFRAPGLGDLLPGLWLLLVGHSFYVLGGLAFRPLRTCGLAYQLGGVAALWPGIDGLQAFALVTGAANLWLAWAVRRRRTAAGASERG